MEGRKKGHLEARKEGRNAIVKPTHIRFRNYLRILPLRREEGMKERRKKRRKRTNKGERREVQKERWEMKKEERR